MNVAIVGAGIMGRMLAWELCRADCRVTLFDRDPAESGGAAAYAAAGMLAPYSELESAEGLIFRMGMQSLDLWRSLARKLERDIGLYAGGSLVVAHRQDRSELERFRRMLESKFDPADPAGFSALDREGLASMEPVLSARFQEALYLPLESRVDNLKAMSALADKLREMEVNWYAPAPVDAVEPGAVTTGGRKMDFDWVADCRGMGAREVIPGLRGVRGELIQVHAPGVGITRMVRLMHPRYRMYLVPGENDTYLLGATQIESEDYSPVSVQSALELLSALYSLHDGFAEARIVATRVNCRPALADNLPRMWVRPGMIRINGLFRHGFLLAPVLAREAARCLTGPDKFEAAYPGIVDMGHATEEAW